LDLSQIGTPDNNYGSSSNLLHIDDKGVFTAQSGSTIQINKSDFTAETSLHGAINTIDEENGYDFASVVNSNAEAYESKFFQIVDGSVDIGNRVSLKDESGALLGEEITIALYEKDSGTHLADLVGGWATIADKTGLYVGQRVEGIRLDQTSIDLFSQPNETVTINQWIESKNDTVNLNITQGTIKLTSDATDFAGDVIVHENANLIVAQDGALGGHVEGTSAAGLQLQKNATAEISEAVNQTISSLSVAEGATLHLNKDSVLTLSTYGSQTQTRMDGILIGEEDSVFNTTGQVFVTDTTELSQMQGTLQMQSETDSWVFSIEEDKNFTKGAIVNGQVIKDGAGTLQLGLEQFNDGSTSVTVNKGGLTFANWNSAGSALNLKNFTLTETAEAFRLSGNMRLNNGRGTFTNQGTVFVGEDATGETDFATRFIRGNWTGNGTIVFDAYLGDNTPTGVEEDLVEETKENTSKTNERVDATYGEKSDLLVIRGTATGDAVLKVNNINSVDSGKLERLALMEVGDDADFNPTLYGGSIEAGGYSYRLVRHDSEGGNLDFGADYILTSYADEESTWTDRNVSVNTGAFIGFAAASQMFDLSIHDRQGTRPYINPLTGEKTQTSMWMRETISHERSHDSTGQLSMRSNTSVTQIGGDIVQLNTSGNGYVFAGLMAGWGTQDLKSRSSRVEAHANADIEGWNIGFYGGWHQNDPAVDRTGAYVNGWLQYSHLKGEFDNHMDSATARASGLSASLEAGYNIRALSWYNDEHFGASEVFIEPRAQVTWWGTEFDDMQMSGDVEFLGKDNITTRLGVRASAVVNGNSTIVPYAEANWVHNTHAYGAKYGELTDHQAGANDTAEMKLGVEFEIHKNFTGYGQFSVNLGNESYSERAGSLGIKYRF
ncbi:MAG TPA: autotransporter outer membrane beta-barrel domain-containing protein, partial [Candidatus Aphodousia faecavium]|nr:autotransporter outer membrane beta-barrel domain-containing protein [Candidatus Aphodousia faecavium]